MINAWCFGGCLLNHPEAKIAYSDVWKGGNDSGNSFLIKQFMSGKAKEGGGLDLLGMSSHHCKEQSERGRNRRRTRAQHLEPAKGLPRSGEVDSLITLYNSWSNRMK